MSKGAQTVLNLTKNIRRPTKYVTALIHEFSDMALDEESAPSFKGRWRESLFKTPSSTALNVEIGPGNGRRFSGMCKGNPDQNFLAVELKYKPLIQTVRRLRRERLNNGRGIRYNGALLDHLFEPLELNNVYIHFPDPWPKRKQGKHRLIQEDFGKKLYPLQRLGSVLEIKTDSMEYLKQIKKIFQSAGYTLREQTEDLHCRSVPRCKGFFQELSQFEALFVKKNVPVGFLSFEKTP